MIVGMPVQSHALHSGGRQRCFIGLRHILRLLTRVKMPEVP